MAFINEDGDDFFTKIGTDVRPRTNGAPAASIDILKRLDQITGMIPELPNDRTVFSDGSPRQWIQSDDAYFEGRPIAFTLKAGLYEIVINNQFGVGLKLNPINTDELIIPPDEVLQSILAEFKLFWECKSRFKARGLLFKRGFLLYGPPGGGKTSLINLLMKHLIDAYQGIIINVDNPTSAIGGLQVVRKIEPQRPLVLILEDIDALITRYGESEFLSLLDGENNIENVVSVATCNYPERLDARFVNRPSRFDKVIKIDMPNAACRKLYLETKEPSLTPEALDSWVEASANFSLAHLKELIVAVRCLGHDFDSVVKRLSKMKYTPKSTEDTNPLGFKAAK